MLPFNWYSAHDLVAFMVMAPLALICCLTYFVGGRRLVDLLFTAWLVCVAAYCFILFLEDNLVREGGSAWAVPEAASRTLDLFRINYALGLVGMVLETHFVLAYCQVRQARSPLVLAAYVVALLALPLIWTPWFLAAPPGPRAPTASWHAVVPWMPDMGPLVTVYTVCWVAVHAGAMVVLVLRRRSIAGGPDAGPLGQISLVIGAFGLLGAAGLLEIGTAALGHASVALLPLASITMAVLISIALVRERLEAERKRERLERELQIAADIQASLLPKDPPSVHGFEMAGWSRQAASVGGDTYDFLPLADGRWIVTLADASGHGLGPALVAAETRAVVRALVSQGGDPGQVLVSAVALIGPGLPTDRFVTCFVGMLDPSRHLLTYASAGQGPIFFYDHARDVLGWEVATGLPVMALAANAPRAAVRRRVLRPGDFLVLVSDGFYEAHNGSREQFGLSRLIEVLRHSRRLAASEILACTRQAVDRFAAGRPQGDDQTMVVIRKSPSPTGAPAHPR